MATDDSEIHAIEEVKGIMAEPIELLERYGKLRERALDHVKKDGDGDPLGEGGEFGQAFWRRAVNALLDPHQWFFPAERLLLDLWDALAQRQRDENTQVPRAMISQYLTEIAFRRDDAPLGFRWALHTQAADILASHGTAGGHGKHWLHGKFGATDAELSLINRLAAECRKAVNGIAWSSAAGFPEEIIRRLCSDRQVGRPLLARAATEDEFHLCPAYLTALWDDVTGASDCNSKGEALEAVASYLCCLLPGCVPQQNVIDPAQAAEYDLLVRNFASRESLTTSSFGREFIVECKNWDATVGVPEVGYFLFRMSSTRTRFGIMFAKRGVSGTSEKENRALALIRREFQQHGVVCVVINEDDIDMLAREGASSFQSLLLTKADEFRFGMPRDSKGK